MGNKTAVHKYQQEYIKDNGHLFTMHQMAAFLGISYQAARYHYKKLKKKHISNACKEIVDPTQWPSLEEYKQIFESWMQPISKNF